MSNAAAERPIGAWTVSFAVATAVGVFLGAVGPYGTHLNGPAHVRIGYWVATAWLSVAILGFTAVASIACARRLGVHPWIVAAPALIVAIAPQAMLIAAFARSIWPDLPPMSWFDWYAQVLAISAFQLAAYGLVRAAVRRGGAPAPLQTLTAITASHASETLCLQMEDHYVRIHTATGSRLVHSTMAHAIAGQGGREGLRVHRSWWVARAAVRAVVWEGRNLRLELTNGLLVPVSRTAIAELRAASWLEPRPAAQLPGA